MTPVAPILLLLLLAAACTRPAHGQLPPDFPLPDATCPDAAPDPGTVFSESAPADVASAPGGVLDASGLDRLSVVSYNLWELYDGRDGDEYFPDAGHPEASTLDEAHAARRVAALAAALAGTDPHVLVLQEVESAELACAVARAAAPDSGWSCWAATWASEPRPQNVAIASRVAGSVVSLDPGPGMGQRGALEFAVDGAGLRIAAVHLKSSVGAVGARDCGNAAKRMAVARGLVERQRSLPGIAYLVIGDLNVDPSDAARRRYDRTGDILALAGDEDLVLRFGATAETPGAGGGRTLIDRAFLRPGPGVDAEALRFVTGAPRGGWASDHGPIEVTLVLDGEIAD